MIAPSGEQIEIVAEDQQAVVVEVGGGLRSYSAGGRELVDGYGAHEMSSSGRGQALIPWLQDGSYEFDGRRHQLPLDEPERRNAIHGLVRWAAWTASTRERHRVVMEHMLYPQPGYPFALRLRIEYALLDNGLPVRTTATNVGAAACPYGSGAHPCISRADLETAADAAGHFGRDQARARTEKRVIEQLAGSATQKSSSHRTPRRREPDSNHRSRSCERSFGCCRRETPDR